MFTVRQVDGAGVEGHGRGKYVSVRRHCQDDRVDGESAVYFPKQIVAFLRIEVPHRRQLRQHREYRFGGSGNLLLLGGQALHHEQGIASRLFDLAPPQVQAGCDDDGNSGQEDNQHEHL